MKKLDLNYDDCPDPEPYATCEEDEFVIGQHYEGIPAKKLYCKVCLCERLIVGKGNYYTAIKCPTCLWEACVHDG